MVTLKLDPSQATLEGVCALLDLRADEVDATFGVVDVGPNDGSYAILIDERVADRVRRSGLVVGAFSDPPIEPFGGRAR